MAFARGARTGLDDPDVFCGKHGIKGSAELRVSVTDQELHHVRLISELHTEVAGLLAHPVADRISRHASNPDSPGVVVDEEKHVDPAE
jgi:hypothetical protein